MSKKLFKYTYDDLMQPANNCIVTTLTQLSEKCKIPYRTLQDIFSKSNVYCDRYGSFKLEKRIHYLAESKIRTK